MPKKYLQIVPSSDPAGPPLSAEIAQAFEQIRERAHQLYQEREAQAAAGNAFDDWLRAERELFTVPAVDLIEEPDLWRLSLSVENSSHEGPRLMVADGAVTVLGEQGAPRPIFRHLELPGVSEASAESARQLRRGEALIEVALPKAVKAEAGAGEGKRKAKAASAGGSSTTSAA